MVTKIKKRTSIVDLAIEKLKKTGKKVEYNAPSLKDIEKAEKALGISFPKAYLEFLSKFEGYYGTNFDGFQVINSKDNYHDILSLNTLIRAGKMIIGKYPKELIAFYDVGTGGDYTCFYKHKSGKIRIVFWEHDDSFEKNIENLNQVYFKNFEEWLEYKLELK